MKTRFYTPEAERFFPICPTTVGFDELQVLRKRPQGLGINQLMLVNKGNGILELGCTRYELNPGDMFFLIHVIHKISFKISRLRELYDKQRRTAE